MAFYQDACPPGVHLTHYVRQDLKDKLLGSYPALARAECAGQFSQMGSGVHAVVAVCEVLATEAPANVMTGPSLLAAHLATILDGRTATIFYLEPAARRSFEAAFPAETSGADIALCPLTAAAEAIAAGDRKAAAALVEAELDASEAEIVVLGQACLSPFRGAVAGPVVTAPEAAMAALDTSVRGRPTPIPAAANGVRRNIRG